MNETMRLDGNAVGGLLDEVFRFEMTMAETVCGACGARKPIAELMLYGHEMGTILRCADCDNALMRITKITGDYRLDFSGMSSLKINANSKLEQV